MTKSRRIWIVGGALLLGATACGEDSGGSGTPSETGGSEASGGSSANGGSTTSGGSTADGGSASGGRDASGGTSTTGGSGQGGPISAANPEEYFAVFSELFCGGLADCCTDAGFAFSGEYCRTLFASAAASFEGLTYDQAAGESCLRNLQAQLGSCTSGGPLLCDGVFLGSVELGGECNQTADCVPSDLGETSCEIVGSQATGQICVVEIRAEEGDPCVETCFVGPGVRSCLNAVPGADEGDPERGQCFLNDGLWCDSSSLECVPSLARGEPCNASPECGAYAVCDGVCADGAPEGGACLDFSECAEGLLCSLEEDLCVTVSEEQLLEGACTTFGAE